MLVFGRVKASQLITAKLALVKRERGDIAVVVGQGIMKDIKARREGFTCLNGDLHLV
jgi:hypothetical protein